MCKYLFNYVCILFSYIYHLLFLQSPSSRVSCKRWLLWHPCPGPPWYDAESVPGCERYLNDYILLTILYQNFMMFVLTILIDYILTYYENITPINYLQILLCITKLLLLN